MFTDPQTITINAVAKVMARVLISGQSAVYETNDGLCKLTISHQLSKGRVRSMARLDVRSVVPDPLTAVNDYETLTFYCVLERPEVGFSATQSEQQITGFKTWLTTTVMGQLYGRES